MQHPGQRHADASSTRTRIGSSRRIRRVAALGLRSMVVVGFVAWLGVEAALMGPAACELAPGTSIYGESAWSWLQLGQVCTWELPVAAGGLEYERGPGFSRWLLVPVLAMWAASLRLLGTTPALIETAAPPSLHR
jgi:hypothetical protein